MTSAENSISEPPNLNIFWRRISPDPPTRLLTAFGTSNNAPQYKNLATALIHNFSSCHQSISNCLSAAIDSFKRFVLQTKNNVQSRFIIKSFLGQLDSFGFTHCMLSEHCLVARLTSCQKNTGKAWH